MARIDILGIDHTYDLSDPVPNSSVLVFVHGWLLSRQYWQPLVQRLSKTYQCLCYDLRGFGESQPNGDRLLQVRDRYTPAAYAKDLEILLDRLNLSNVWLVGHSLGGTVALWMAYQFPQRVRGVVCLNSGGGIYLKEEFERFRTAGVQIVRWRPVWLAQFPFIDWLFARAAVAQPLDRTWGRQRVLDFVCAHPEAARGALLDSTTEDEVHRLPQIVSQLQQPVYFIAGAKDRIMEPKYVRHLASFHHLFDCCGDNTIEVENCGHLSMVEQPDLIASRLSAIVRQYEMRE
ncbi:alpha/beta fold hydrolase [Baaleninema simplex]|uniref:alpha/beta fold hydrolase n=1 Tax=Baaleninema simplex TaxID=2862350 RepID=UPI0003473D5B|nr:alpha/beta hydrolase [Baaleninema simplex]